MNETEKLRSMLLENRMDPSTAAAVTAFAKEKNVAGKILEILEDYEKKSKIRNIPVRIRNRKVS